MIHFKTELFSYSCTVLLSFVLIFKSSTNLLKYNIWSLTICYGEKPCYDVWIAIKKERKKDRKNKRKRKKDRKQILNQVYVYESLHV